MRGIVVELHVLTQIVRAPRAERCRVGIQSGHRDVIPKPIFRPDQDRLAPARIARPGGAREAQEDIGLKARPIRGRDEIVALLLPHRGNQLIARNDGGGAGLCPGGAARQRDGQRDGHQPRHTSSATRTETSDAHPATTASCRRYFRCPL